jgi:hypothetical protein
MKIFLNIITIIMLLSCQDEGQKSYSNSKENIYNEKLFLDNQKVVGALKNYANRKRNNLDYSQNEYRIWRLFLTEIDTNYVKIVLDCGFPSAKPLAYFMIDYDIFFVYIFSGKFVPDTTYYSQIINKFQADGIYIKKQKTGEFVYASEYKIYSDTIIEKMGLKDITIPPAKPR